MLGNKEQIAMMCRKACAVAASHAARPKFRGFEQAAEKTAFRAFKICMEILFSGCVDPACW
jgi:hypothetical protein